MATKGEIVDQFAHASGIAPVELLARIDDHDAAASGTGANELLGTMLDHLAHALGTTRDCVERTAVQNPHASGISPLEFVGEILDQDAQASGHGGTMGGTGLQRNAQNLVAPVVLGIVGVMWYHFKLFPLPFTGLRTEDEDVDLMMLSPGPTPTHFST